MEPDAKERSHALALSLRENGNKWRWIALLGAPSIFKGSQTSGKTERFKKGSSMVYHQIEIVAPLR